MRCSLFVLVSSVCLFFLEANCDWLIKTITEITKSNQLWMLASCRYTGPPGICIEWFKGWSKCWWVDKTGALKKKVWYINTITWVRRLAIKYLAESACDKSFAYCVLYLYPCQSFAPKAALLLCIFAFFSITFPSVTFRLVLLCSLSFSAPLLLHAFSRQGRSGTPRCLLNWKPALAAAASPSQRHRQEVKMSACSLTFRFPPSFSSPTCLCQHHLPPSKKVIQELKHAQMWP